MKPILGRAPLIKRLVSENPICGEFWGSTSGLTVNNRRIEFVKRMDNNQGQAGSGEAINIGTPAAIDHTADWRCLISPYSREQIIGKITYTLAAHFPFTGSVGMYELKDLARRFEEKVYMAATSQDDYLKQIAMKMIPIMLSQYPLQLNGANTVQNSSRNVNVTASGPSASGPSASGPSADSAPGRGNPSA